MKNNRNKAAVVAPAVPADDRGRTLRDMTLLALAAAGIAALLTLARPAAGEPAAFGFAYTADELGGTVSRIELESSKVETVPVGIMPHNVQFVPATGRLLAVGTAPEANHDDGHGAESAGHADDAAGGRLLVLDTAALASGPVAEITAGAHPAHVVADAGGRRAFVTDSEDDCVFVIDLELGRTLARVLTGDYPHGLRMSPDQRSLYVANVKDGTVSVIDTTALSEVARIEVGAAPVQVGFVPDGCRVFVSLRDEDKVAVIDTATRKVTARISVGRSPIQVHATPDGRFVYVANQGTSAMPDDTVSVIDVAAGTVVRTIRTGAGAHGVTVSDDGAFVFVSNIVDATVSQIAVASQTVAATYAVGKGPNGITFQAPKTTTSGAG